MNFGVFGKIPSHGDFVAMGTGSDTGRSFEQWLQMANDQVAHRGGALPPGPIGFCFRGESAASLLVGVMVGSVDRVGRTFPLAVFCELTSPSQLQRIAGSPPVLTPTLAAMAELTAAEHESAQTLKDAVGALSTPSSLATAFDEVLTRLRSMPLDGWLERTYGVAGAAYAIHVLRRAAEHAGRDGPRRATMLDARVTSDMELAFWFACVRCALAPDFGPTSAFWDVPSQRVILALGTPDSNVLTLLESPQAQHRKLWPTTTERPEAHDRARDGLGGALGDVLGAPDQSTVGDLLDALASDQA